jgi:hypothetical protein
MMMKPAFDDDEADKPLAPEVEAVRRKLARLMAVSVGTMLIGLMAVLFALVYKLSGPSGTQTPAIAGSPAAGTAAGNLAVTLPAGAEIVSHTLSGASLSFDVRLADGRREIHVFDLTANKTIAVVTVRQ